MLFLVFFLILNGITMSSELGPKFEIIIMFNVVSIAGITSLYYYNI